MTYIQYSPCDTMRHFPSLIHSRLFSLSSSSYSTDGHFKFQKNVAQNKNTIITTTVTTTATTSTKTSTTIATQIFLEKLLFLVGVNSKLLIQKKVQFRMLNLLAQQQQMKLNQRINNSMFNEQLIFRFEYTKII